MAPDGPSWSRMPPHDSNMTPRRPEVAFWWPNMVPIAHEGPWGVTDGLRMALRWDRMAPDGLNIAPRKSTHDQRKFVSSWFVAISAVVASRNGKRLVSGELRCSMSASTFFSARAKLQCEELLARRFNRCSATRTVPAKCICTPCLRCKYALLAFKHTSKLLSYGR